MNALRTITTTRSTQAAFQLSSRGVVSAARAKFATDNMLNQPCVSLRPGRFTTARKFAFIKTLRRLDLFDPAFAQRCFSAAVSDQNSDFALHDIQNSLCNLKFGGIPVHCIAQLDFRLWTGGSKQMTSAQFEAFYAAGCRADLNLPQCQAVVREMARSAFRCADVDGDGALNQTEFIDAYDAFPSALLNMALQHFHGI